MRAFSQMHLSISKIYSERLPYGNFGEKISVKWSWYFFGAPKKGTGLSCTIYKILVNFSLSLDMKPGTSNPNKRYWKFQSFWWKQEKGNTAVPQEVLLFFGKISLSIHGDKFTNLLLNCITIFISASSRLWRLSNCSTFTGQYPQYSSPTRIIS